MVCVGEGIGLDVVTGVGAVVVIVVSVGAGVDAAVVVGVFTFMRFCARVHVCEAVLRS